MDHIAIMNNKIGNIDSIVFHYANAITPYSLFTF